MRLTQIRNLLTQFSCLNANEKEMKQNEIAKAVCTSILSFFIQPVFYDMCCVSIYMNKSCETQLSMILKWN